jgi:hypothetical protein
MVLFFAGACEVSCMRVIFVNSVNTFLSGKEFGYYFHSMCNA